jgi:hypothetical protein
MRRREKTSVHHWRYEDGWQDTPTVFLNRDPTMPLREFREEIVGWHCWVYPADDREFENWMTQNMKGEYDCTHRFNSGDDMWTVNITNDQDAAFFKLTWM